MTMGGRVARWHSLSRLPDVHVSTCAHLDIKDMDSINHIIIKRLESDLMADLPTEKPASEITFKTNYIIFMSK